MYDLQNADVSAPHLLWIWNAEASFKNKTHSFLYKYWLLDSASDGSDHEENNPGVAGVSHYSASCCWIISADSSEAGAEAPLWCHRTLQWDEPPSCCPWDVSVTQCQSASRATTASQHKRHLGSWWCHSRLKALEVLETEQSSLNWYDWSVKHGEDFVTTNTEAGLSPDVSCSATMWFISVALSEMF